MSKHPVRHHTLVEHCLVKPYLSHSLSELPVGLLHISLSASRAWASQKQQSCHLIDRVRPSWHFISHNSLSYVIVSLIAASNSIPLGFAFNFVFFVHSQCQREATEQVVNPHSPF